MSDIQKRHISITFQEGPIQEVGENGCQLRDVLEVCLEELNSLNAVFPCRENALAITKLEEAVHWLDHRTRDREARGVEGHAKP